MTLDVEALRRCGYSRCGRPLNYTGQGRPPEYCADRRWDPDQRTCKQLAAAERAGERAAGLDAPLDAFRAAGDRFVPAAQELARQLGDVVAAVVEVRDGAVSRAATADHAAVAAVDRAHAAEAAATAAQRAQSVAEVDRDRAVRAARTAEDAATAARTEADARIAEAYQRVAAADHARGQAEATAQADRLARLVAEERAGHADRRQADLTAQLAAAEQVRLAQGEQLAAAERVRVDLVASLTAAHRATDVERSTRLAEVGGLRADLSVALTRAEAATADADRLRAEVIALRAETATIRAELAAAQADLAARRAAATGGARSRPVRRHVVTTRRLPGVGAAVEYPQPPFLSSHQLAEVEAVCDRVAILRAGRLIQVASIGELRGLHRSEVTLTYTGTPPALTAIAGVGDVQSAGEGRLRFTLTGPPSAALQALAAADITGLAVREPSLEEIFLDYYGTGSTR